MGVPWTKKDKQELTKLWPHFSSAVIGQKMGRSRGSVIGQAHRLNLENKVPLRGKTRLTPHMVQPVPLGCEPVDPVPFLEAKAHHCRAILDGRGEDGLVMFCGKTIMWGQSFSYCSDHLRRYTVKGYSR